jgi:hypothetical protein
MPWEALLEVAGGSCKKGEGERLVRSNKSDGDPEEKRTVQMPLF